MPLERSDEPYHRHADGPEIVPLAAPDGVRTYLRLQPSLALPDLRTVVDFSPVPTTDRRVGTLAGSRFAATIPPIGNVQAWHYPAVTRITALPNEEYRAFLGTRACTLRQRMGAIFRSHR